MTVFPSKWRLVINEEIEIEEDRNQTRLLQRIIMEPSGHRYYKIELFYYNQLVFMIDSDPSAEPRMIIAMVEGKNPLEVLMEDANREMTK